MKKEKDIKAKKITRESRTKRKMNGMGEERMLVRRTDVRRDITEKKKSCEEERKERENKQKQKARKNVRTSEVAK